MSKPIRVRCLLKSENGQFVGICIDWNLAAQGDSPEEAKDKLEQMMHSYVQEAFTIHREYKDQLLHRKAPLSLRVEYHWAKLRSILHHGSNGNSGSPRYFDECLNPTAA